MNSAQVVQRAEISYRQLDYWTRKGYLKVIPGTDQGTGHDRQYVEAQVEKARWMRCLTSLGIAAAQAERIAQKVIEGNKTIYLGHGITVHIEKHSH